MHIAQPNVQLSPDGTWYTPDLAAGIAVLFVLQFEEEHSPSPHGHKAGHTVEPHNATPQLTKPNHGTNPSLCSHYNSCTRKRKINIDVNTGILMHFFFRP